MNNREAKEDRKPGLGLKVSKEIESLIPYPPGKPIEELERELGITGSIKLASNENPIGPSTLALEAIKEAAGGVNRYPDGSCFYLKRKLSEKLGLPMESIFIGNGSNEVIELLVRVFASKGEVIYPEPSFAVYSLAVQATQAVGVAVPLKGDLTIDLGAMAQRIGPRTRLVFIANPNNPTGTMVDSDEFAAFMDVVPPGVIVCMDEAYAEYVRAPDYPVTLDYVLEGRAVVGLRTFSKIYGLAGLRIGYGFAPPEIVDFLERVRQPFNVNTLAQSAALSAIDDIEHVKRSRDVNAEGLKYLYAEIEKLSLEYVETEANFFLIKVGDGMGVYNALLKRGVIVRPMASYGLDDYIRVSVGLVKENERFIETLSDVLAQGL